MKLFDGIPGSETKQLPNGNSHYEPAEPLPKIKVGDRKLNFDIFPIIEKFRNVLILCTSQHFFF